MARGIQEGDQAVVDLDLIGTDGLGDAAGLACGNVGFADGIQNTCLLYTSVIKLAMVRVWKRLQDEKMESRLILTVHDELIVEAPEAEAEKAAQILREEMEGCVQYAVPLSTDVHAGKNWLEAH